MPKLEFSDAASFMGTLVSRYSTYANPGTSAYLELHQLIDDLCVLYLSASEKNRAQIRNLAAGLPRTIEGQMLNHIGWASNRVLSSNDGEWVRRGLAAASIDDNRTDFRDTLNALGDLYLTASRVGIDCSRYFQEAAELSSTQHGILPSLSSMRDFLANFEQSAYFEEDVRPMIGRYETPRLRNEILNVLAEIWDPLGVKNGRYSRNEYDSYIHDIYVLLVKDKTDAQITEHLCRTARNRMEMEPPPSTADTVRALRAIKLSEG